MQRTFRIALAATFAMAFVLATGSAALGYGGKTATCMVNGNLVASGRYWEPNATITITSTVVSSPGSTTTDSKGNFSVQLVLNSGTPAGTYSVTFTRGADSCTATFKVTKPKATSFTSKGGPTVTVGMVLLLVLLGGVVFFVPRAIVRRRAPA
jgi:hypothetical protein